MNAHQAGQKLLCGDYTAYTPTGKSLFVRAGRWFTIPIDGDIVYFYHASMGRVAHVGVVVTVRKNFTGTYTMKVGEGNTAPGKYSRDGGCVALKEYTFHPNEVGGKNLINGFGRPFYGEDTCTVKEMIDTVLGEVGYVEKASDNGLDIKTANPGNRNRTKYGRWYGLNGEPWCQMLVSWCAYTACAAHRANAITGWVKEGNAWFYIEENGHRAAGKWLYINGRWYVFDNAGALIRNTWFKDTSGVYYIGEDGGMISGQWVSYKGEQYYLTKTGVLARNAYVRSEKEIAPGRGYIYYYVNKEGQWDVSKDTETPDFTQKDIAE
nr:MAG TPA: hypothetical protein [Siphoviridae sp. ctYuc6]